MNTEAITKLATLARLATTPEEEARFASDIGGVLAYIDTITTVAVPETNEGVVFSTALREDIAIDQSDATREAIRVNFPRREGDYLVVPKVL
jgi:aspartyl-tRNA(Asn)/glutamyl-tRNA(Gln) amidotransferase subunit C